MNRSLFSRRRLLSVLPFADLANSAERGGAVPSEIRRFSDPTTEFPVYRLTSATHSSFLPALYNSAISRRTQFLLYTNDRDGTPQAFRMDLKSGESRRLTDAKALNASSCTLLPDDRSFCCLDGRSVLQINL